MICGAFPAVLSPSRADESEPLSFVLTGSGDASVSPRECGPSVAGDEIPTFPSALPDREGASLSLPEPQDQEDLEPIRKRMKGGQSLGVLCVSGPCGKAWGPSGTVGAAPDGASPSPEVRGHVSGRCLWCLSSF